MALADFFVAGAFAVAVTAAGAAWALVALQRRSARVAWDAFADSRGWDHDEGEVMVPGDAFVPPAYQDADHVFAGPARAGPFRAFVRDGVGVLVWIGMPESSPRFRVRPHGRFVRHRDVAKDAGLPASCSHLLSRFDLEGDQDVVVRRLGPGVAALLMRPERAVDVRWEGTDLWVRFPVETRSPEAVARLVTFADALAGALLDDESRAPPRPLAVDLPDTMRRLAPGPASS